LEIKQQLKMSQQLVMTPQLQQAIKLLQMSRMELVDLVREEMLQNPVLEDQVETGETPERRNGASETAANDTAATSTPETLSIDRAVAADDKASADASRESEKKTDEFDWERYLENHALQAPIPSFRGGGDSDELPGIEATLSRGDDLVDHLAWQLRMDEFLEEELRFAALVLGNLNDDGMLVMDQVPPEDVVPRLAQEAAIDPEDAEEILSIIQRLDPVGTAARSLRECLRVQAEHHGMDDLVLRVIDQHLPNLERRNVQAIAKDLDVPIEEVLDVAQVIAELDPRPGRNLNAQETHYITPDVYVHKIGDEYYVVPNDDGMPRLKISGFYRAAMADNPKAKEYIQGKLRSAQWLIRSIDQRRKTIVKVTECIVEKQHDFFEKGIEYLKPMILRDVADTVGMHESTISRVTSNKYVHTPRGIFELKYFFNSAIRRDNQDDIASESVKQAIKKIIGSENPKSPYSDQKIVQILSGDGIKIARRTVAKYREMMGILSSSKRKQLF